ncbi:MAG: MBL fold metallo-hydrolase [Thermococci archaeon]|nr:MBL fold metallo-hydrolase [Thermococci archaeon]
MKVLDNVHLVDGTNANVYLVIRDGKVALIDTGLPGEHEKVIRYLDGLGFAPEDVDLIVLTHSHHDHAGSLMELKELTGAKVAAHREEIPRLTEKVLKWSGRRIDVEVPLEDGDEIAGLRVVHSPGHTPGSIVLHSRALRAIFPGDLVYEEEGRLHEIPHRYSLDPEMNREAIKNVLRLDFEHVLPSHGRPILNEGRKRWRELVEELGLK